MNEADLLFAVSEAQGYSVGLVRGGSRILLLTTEERRGFSSRMKERAEERRNTTLFQGRFPAYGGTLVDWWEHCLCRLYTCDRDDRPPSARITFSSNLVDDLLPFPFRTVPALPGKVIYVVNCQTSEVSLFYFWWFWGPGGNGGAVSPKCGCYSSRRNGCAMESCVSPISPHGPPPHP